MRVAETVEVSAVVWREEKLYVALCLELDVVFRNVFMYAYGVI